MTRTRAPREADPSLTQLLRKAFLFAVCGFVSGLFAGCITPMAREPLDIARKNHHTQLLRTGPAPILNGPSDPVEFRHLTEPRSDSERVEFMSGNLRLFGYLIKPVGPGPHPAVLYAHSGFNLRDFDMENAKEFAKNGFVVFVPAWRAENGNPGQFEMWYGEVDDASAALSYLKSLPMVDPDRVYATGHSAGGTLAILLAESDPRVRAVATSGAPLGAPNWPWIPFNLGNRAERGLRSANQHVGNLRVPLALFYGRTGGDEINLPSARQMAGQAPDRITVTVIENGDHGTAMRLAIPQMIRFFLQH